MYTILPFRSKKLLKRQLATLTPFELAALIRLCREGWGVADEMCALSLSHFVNIFFTKYILWLRNIFSGGQSIEDFTIQ